VREKPAAVKYFYRHRILRGSIGGFDRSSDAGFDHRRIL
jgi:hypothetical protein